jgi:hypothetical protein
VKTGSGHGSLGVGRRKGRQQRSLTPTATASLLDSTREMRELRMGQCRFCLLQSDSINFLREFEHFFYVSPSHPTRVSGSTND